MIERLRKLGESPRPLNQLYALAVGSALDDRMNGFSDRQIGQLLFDFCWPECYFNSPELIIVTQAIDRLRRSAGGAVTSEEAQDNLKQQPVCPKCGNEMFLHYGIDEPDFWLCDCVSCRHKRYVRQAGHSTEPTRAGSKDGGNLQASDRRDSGFLNLCLPTIRK